MNLALLAPLGLLALAALALPILLHLVRRLELATTEFAALRWISERIRPQHRLRIERPWLLLLRLCLLALLALLLAQPVWNRETPLARSWIVVVPGASLGEARVAAGNRDGEWHWLAPGFPAIEQPPATRTIAAASLLRELDERLPRDARLTVIAPQRVRGLDGERPRLSRTVEWSVVSGEMAAAPLASAAPITLAVRYAPEAESSLRWLRAAVDVWNLAEPGHYRLDAQAASNALPPSDEWLVWLAPPGTALTRWLESGGRAVAIDPAADGEPLWRSADGRVLARRAAAGPGWLVALAGALTPAELPILLDADFPQRLQAALAPPAAAPEPAAAAALQPILDKSIAANPSAPPSARRALEPWLALLIAALFALERLVATRRPRGADA